jgi:hypothetical protein
MKPNPRNVPYDGQLVGIKVFETVARAIPMARFTVARRMCSYAEPLNHFWFVDTNQGIFLEDWEVEEWYGENND